MTLNKLSNYRRDAVSYSGNKSAEPLRYNHNFESDYQLVFVANANRHNVEALIAKNYKLAAVFDVHWSKKHFADNIKRLGLASSNLKLCDTEDTIQLTAIIFQVESPRYNLTAADFYQIDWQASPLASLLNDVILITDNIESFFYNGALILGLTTLQSVFSSDEMIVKALTKDLEGAEGWQDFTEMFNIANTCANWLVLRNAEFLPDNFWGNDKDIDVLCNHIPNFVFAVNAKVKGEDGANFEVKIAKQNIDVDMRVIGDEYYDSSWESDMLVNKVYNGIVPLMNNEDYLYSLLYHARIHKTVVKPIYIPRLTNLAKELGFELDQHIFTSNELCAKFMDAYFINKGYKFTYPSDYPCFESLNRKVINHLSQIQPQHTPLVFKVKLFRNQLFLLGCKLFPRSLKELAKRVLGR